MALLTLGLMYASFIGIGWLASRRQGAGTADDFMVAGRAMPLWLATFTMTATWVDGGYLLGTAEGVYRTSLASGLQGGVCFGISLIIGGLFFARRMRALEFHTLIDPFEAPGVGTPVPGGVTFREAHLALEILADSGAVTSMEVVEVNPTLDDRNRTSELAVGLIASALGQRIL